MFLALMAGLIIIGISIDSSGNGGRGRQLAAPHHSAGLPPARGAVMQGDILVE
jgi:hypothetical protein